MATQFGDIVQHLRSAILQEDQVGLTDEQLLGRFIDHRDEAAVAALVARHGSMVWGVCRRLLGNHHDAEDAFQATFLVLVRRAKSIDPRRAVGNWLYGVAHQTSVKARAMLAKRRTRELQTDAVPEPPAPQHDAWRDLQPVLDQELSLLPDKYRTAIVLCDLEGLTRTEAARQLGLPEGTLAGHVSRGRALLAKRLSRMGLSVSGAALAVLLSHHAAQACVPAAALKTNIRTMMLVATGQAVQSSGVSTFAAALTEGVMTAMFLSKLRTMMAVLLVLGAIGFGGGLFSQDLVGGLRGPDQPNKDAAAAQERPASARDKPIDPPEPRPAKEPKRPVPKDANRIQPGDRLTIEAANTLPDMPINRSRQYVVEPEGTVNLGLGYGRVQVQRLTFVEAEKVIQDHLSQVLKNPSVSVERCQDGGTTALEARVRQLENDVRALQANLDEIRKKKVR